MTTILETITCCVWWDDFGYVAGEDRQHPITMHYPGVRHAAEEFGRIKFGSDNIRVTFISKGLYRVEKIEK
jgi:hypothetical protein